MGEREGDGMTSFFLTATGSLVFGMERHELELIRISYVLSQLADKEVRAESMFDVAPHPGGSVRGRFGNAGDQIRADRPHQHVPYHRQHPWHICIRCMPLPVQGSRPGELAQQRNTIPKKQSWQPLVVNKKHWWMDGWMMFDCIFLPGKIGACLALIASVCG